MMDNNLKVNVIVTRDEMAYMVQRVVANMEDKMLSQIFYDKALEGIRKEVTNIDEANIIYTNRFISVPATISVEKAGSEADVTSLLSCRIVNSITESYKVASVLVSTDTCESISYIKGNGSTFTITNSNKDECESFEESIIDSL